MKKSGNENEKNKLSAVELTDRLIEDINKSALIRVNTSDPFTELRKIKNKEEFGFMNVLTAINVHDFDNHLSNLAQFINWNETIVAYNKGENIEISIFQRDIKANKEKIIDVFQKLLDDKNHIEAYEDISISEFLTQQLDMLHDAAGY